MENCDRVIGRSGNCQPQPVWTSKTPFLSRTHTHTRSIFQKRNKKKYDPAGAARQKLATRDWAGVRRLYIRRTRRRLMMSFVFTAVSCGPVSGGAGGAVLRGWVTHGHMDTRTHLSVDLVSSARHGSIDGFLLRSWYVQWKIWQIPVKWVRLSHAPIRKLNQS